jgi:nicotinamide-nucleotide amidase
MQVEILTIGDEVLSGRTVDTNFAFLARALETVNVQIGWHTTVGDIAPRIGEALRAALGRADAVVATGGLGPTPDDLTRKAVATTLRRPLELDEDVLAAIRERAKRSRRKVPISIETQALIPRGAEVWKNPVGTAPGLLMMTLKKPVILLPGVPAEMEALTTQFVVPYLQKRSGRFVESFTLRTSGVWESMLHEKIGSLPQQWPGASLAYLPSYFGVDLRVTVSGTEEPAVQAATGKAYESLKAVVAPVVYAEGVNTIEQVVGELLVGKGWTIAVAESCTGGLLAKRLTDVPGSSRYVERGFVTYSNRAKVEMLGVREADLEAHGAVSAAVAEAMAKGAREKSGAEVGVAITGIAGPDGGTAKKPVGTVFIALSTPEGETVRDYKIVSTRAGVRERSVQQALDLVRRRLLGLSLDPSLD